MSQRSLRKLPNSTVGLLFGGVAVAFAGGTYLYVRAVTGKSGFNSDRPLPHSAGIRGQFINTGSRDVGPDNTEHNPYIRHQREKQRLAEEKAALEQQS